MADDTSTTWVSVFDDQAKVLFGDGVNDDEVYEYLCWIVLLNKLRYVTSSDVLLYFKYIYLFIIYVNFVGHNKFY